MGELADAVKWVFICPWIGHRWGDPQPGTWAWGIPVERRWCRRCNDVSLRRTDLPPVRTIN